MRRRRRPRPGPVVSGEERPGPAEGEGDVGPNGRPERRARRADEGARVGRRRAPAHEARRSRARGGAPRGRRAGPRRRERRAPRVPPERPTARRRRTDEPRACRPPAETAPRQRVRPRPIGVRQAPAPPGRRVRQGQRPAVGREPDVVVADGAEDVVARPARPPAVQGRSPRVVANAFLQRPVPPQTPVGLAFGPGAGRGPRDVERDNGVQVEGPRPEAVRQAQPEGVPPHVEVPVDAETVVVAGLAPVLDLVDVAHAEDVPHSRGLGER